MIEVIKLSKEDPSIDKLWSNILTDSFNYSQKKYGYNKDIGKDIKLFWETVQKDFVYVVIKQNKGIGFLFFDLKDNVLSFKLFMYSRACPMSLRTLLKVAIFRFMLETLKEESDIKSLSFYTWHPSIISLAKMYLPKLQITMYTPSDIDCFTNSITLEEKELFKIILDKNIKQNINIENYDEFKIVV